MSSADELQENLQNLEQQRYQVMVAQASNPQNEALAKLLGDLDEAIRVTRELLTDAMAAPSEPSVQLDEANNNSSNNNDANNNTAPQVQQEAAFKVGEYVYGLYQGSWYVAIVTGTLSHNDDKSAAGEIEYIVRYIGYNNTDALCLSKNNIKKYQDLSPDYFQQGTKCLAMFNSDQTFYEAVIDKITEDKKSCFVSFVGYGGLQETPLKHIRLINQLQLYAPQQTFAQQQQQLQQAKINNEKKEMDKSKRAEIEKKKKKKEKKKQNLMKKEEERVEKQKKWQDFLSKSSSMKGVKRSVTAKPEENSGSSAPAPASSSVMRHTAKMSNAEDVLRRRF